MPIKTDMLGIDVLVERIDMTDADRIIANCARGTSHQRIPIIESPQPDPPPNGSASIHAYRRWARGR